MTVVANYLAEEPIFFTFVIIGIGTVLGAIKVKGVGLGAAMVLFTAIILSAWGDSLGYEIRVPAELGTFGLVLFAFSIGNNAGANFFSVLKKGAGPIVMMVALFGVAGVTAYLLGTKVMGMDTTVVAGTFAGSLTNTPTLATVGEASGDIGNATVGYAVAYLFGVIGMIIAAELALKQAPNDTDTPEPVTHMTFRVEREDTPTLRAIGGELPGAVEFSRLRRGEEGPVWVPSLSDVIEKNDLLTVVGPVSHFKAVECEVGHRSSHSLRADRRLMDFRRITISNHKLAGMTVGQVDEELEKRWNARLSRVRRGDDDSLATPDYMLELGDRVRVVGPTLEMPNISKWMGDSATGLTDINPISLGLGLALGIFIGEFSIPLPGGAEFAIGSAAGVLIIGLIMGKIGRIGPVVTALPNTANQVLGELGLLVFLAQAGSNAGGQILDAFSSGAWWKILLLGIVLTSIVAAGLYASMRGMFKMGGTKLSGLIAGAQTQPAILALANGQTKNDPRVALGYALVYPVAMIAKIIVGYILATL